MVALTPKPPQKEQAVRRIFEVGLYREIGGGIAEITVVDEKNGVALGRDSLGDWNSYSLYGVLGCSYCGSRFDLDGPWTPTPPDGFALCDRDIYRAKEGDKVWLASIDDWLPCLDTIGRTAKESDEIYLGDVPHWFATPIAATTESTPGWKPTCKLEWHGSELLQMWTRGEDLEWKHGMDFCWRPIPTAKE